MMPLVTALGASPVIYRETWRGLQNRFWRLGHRIKWWGDAYYGSGWNALIPVVDEWLLARRIRNSPDIIHFIWSEFASPRRPTWFNAGHRPLVGTFHASARKLPEVIRAEYRALDYFDAITLMSQTQRSFFAGRGFSDQRMRVILHGVVTEYFCPASRVVDDVDRPLRALLVGSTERDHAFMADLLRRIPRETLALTVITNRQQRDLYYHDVSGVVFPEQLSADELRSAYQHADLLIMPVHDCTANNAILESMACGTPVMVNRIGGVSEYVSPDCNFIMERKDVDEWIDVLMKLKADRTALEAKRPAVRAWAETFDWSIRAREYLSFYNELLAAG